MKEDRVSGHPDEAAVESCMGHILDGYKLWKLFVSPKQNVYSHMRIMYTLEEANRS